MWGISVLCFGFEESQAQVRDTGCLMIVTGAFTFNRKDHTCHFSDRTGTLAARVDDTLLPMFLRFCQVRNQCLLLGLPVTHSADIKEEYISSSTCL